MLALVMSAAILAPSVELDRLWRKLATDASRGDAAAFASDRNAISKQDEQALLSWGARLRESYELQGHSVVTFDLPAEDAGYFMRAAYFAVVTPRQDFAQPTLWKIAPADPAFIGQAWSLTVSGCDLKTGESLYGHPRYWRTWSSRTRPSYSEFKSGISKVVKRNGEFPADTTAIQAVGYACLNVGDVTPRATR